MDKKGTGGFFNHLELTRRQKRYIQAHDEAYQIVGTPNLWRAIREFEMQHKRGELSRLRVGIINSNNPGYVYFNSTNEEEQKCLAYLDFRNYTLVRLGDEVTISGPNMTGCVEGIQYNQDEDAIHCVVGFKEKDVEMIVPPSTISKNCTLELGDRD